MQKKRARFRALFRGRVKETTGLRVHDQSGRAPAQQQARQSEESGAQQEKTSRLRGDIKDPRSKIRNCSNRVVFSPSFGVGKASLPKVEFHSIEIEEQAVVIKVLAAAPGRIEQIVIDEVRIWVRLGRAVDSVRVLDQADRSEEHTS